MITLGTLWQSGEAFLERSACRIQFRCLEFTWRLCEIWQGRALVRNTKTVHELAAAQRPCRTWPKNNILERMCKDQLVHGDLRAKHPL
eukprot:9484587-Pyramimonas_sp.AAC.1